jgi:hypothetical protein
MTPTNFVWDAEKQDPPEVLLRMAKMPNDGKMTTDKGFDRHDRHMPWYNQILVARILREREVKQYHELEQLSQKLSVAQVGTMRRQHSAGHKTTK